MTRRSCQGLMLTLIVAAAIAAPAAMQDKGGFDATGPYDVVENWFKPLHEGRMQNVTGVFAQSPDRIFVTTESEGAAAPAGGRGARGAAQAAAAPQAPTHRHALIVVDRNGKMVEEWTALNTSLGLAHAVEISPYDPEKHVWIIDRDAHQILKYTNDGKRVVMTLGEKGVSGEDDKHFFRPADVAFLPDGTFFVADGYGNARVVKFDKNGKYLTAWGSKGTGPGQFNLVHCVAVDSRRRVYVADRNNSRVQIFDENGKFLEEWRNIIYPSHLIVTQDQFLWVLSAQAKRFAKYDLNGKLLTYWGTTPGTFPGGMNTPHQFSVDAEGNVYIADYTNPAGVQKFTPKKNADRSRLIGQPFK